MTQSEFDKASTSEAVEELLARVESLLQFDYQRTAYNFLVDYLEFPDWFSSHEGGRLLLLSLEVLHGIPQV
jgi:hypothetical protein